MHSRIALVSEDNDFFDYIIHKLSLRLSDEVFRFSFEDLPEKSYLLETALLIVNAENNNEKTLELLDIFKNAPMMVFTYTVDPQFKLELLKKGVFDYITFDTTDDEFEAKIVSALNYISSLEKNHIYREILVKNNIITKNNEVYVDYNSVLDIEIEKLKNSSQKAVLAAIAPSEKSKFLLNSNQIETIILNNIRENDILMSYSASKYFLLLHNTDITSAKAIWEKIRSKINENIYAGFAQVTPKSRQQLINEVLNKLHEEINKDMIEPKSDTANQILGNNFKQFRQDFKKKIEKIITPAFYHIQQKYNDKLFGMTINAGFGDGYAQMVLKSKYQEGCLKITSPGFSKINIDISSKNINNSNFPQSKRISLEPEELDGGLLEDLLEQFVTEFKSEAENEFVK